MPCDRRLTVVLVLAELGLLKGHISDDRRPYPMIAAIYARKSADRDGARATRSESVKLPGNLVETLRYEAQG